MSLYEDIATTGIMNPSGMCCEEFDLRERKILPREYLAATGRMNPLGKSLEEIDRAYL